MLIIWTEMAKNNLDDYMLNSSIVYQSRLEKYVDSLINYVNELHDFERLGKFLFNKGKFEIRQLIYKIHRIFYAIYNDTIYILCISPATRDIGEIMQQLNGEIFDTL